MKYLALVFGVTLSVTVIHAQNQMKPEDTEVWEPVPEVVTPGHSDDTAPSDAQVLFDGTNLDQLEWGCPIMNHMVRCRCCYRITEIR